MANGTLFIIGTDAPIPGTASPPAGFVCDESAKRRDAGTVERQDGISRVP